MDDFILFKKIPSFHSFLFVLNRLRKRFMIFGILNFIFAPFIGILLILFFIFRYGEEYHKNPSAIGSRQYSPLARWKFRDFNEYPHLFQQRLNRSYKKAMKYIYQFPKENTVILARLFVLIFVYYYYYIFLGPFLNFFSFFFRLIT